MTIIGGVIAAVTVLGAAAVVFQGKSSVEKAEKLRDAAAAGDNRYAQGWLVHPLHHPADRVHALPVYVAYSTTQQELTHVSCTCLYW